jgi:hypothetical protein
VKIKNPNAPNAMIAGFFYGSASKAEATASITSAESAKD